MTCTRRTAALGAASLLFAPAIVRAESLMRLRGVTVAPIEPVYLGFNDRLRLYHQFGLVLPARVYSWPSLFEQGRQVRLRTCLASFPSSPRSAESRSTIRHGCSISSSTVFVGSPTPSPGACCRRTATG